MSYPRTAKEGADHRESRPLSPGHQLVNILQSCKLDVLGSKTSSGTHCPATCALAHSMRPKLWKHRRDSRLEARHQVHLQALVMLFQLLIAEARSEVAYGL